MVYGSAGKSGDPGNVQSATSGEDWGLNVSNPPSPPEFSFNCENIVLTVADPAKPFCFVSRAGEDAQWGSWIDGVLRAAGHECFVQEHDIQVGHSFPREIREAMERAEHVVAVLSPDYLRKDHTMAELDTAYAMDPRGAKRVMIMVRVRPCEIPK